MRQYVEMSKEVVEEMERLVLDEVMNKYRAWPALIRVARLAEVVGEELHVKSNVLLQPDLKQVHVTINTPVT